MSITSDWFTPGSTTGSWFPQPPSTAAASGGSPAGSIPPEAIAQILALLMGLSPPRSSATGNPSADANGAGFTGGGTDAGNGPSGLAAPSEMGGPAIGASQFAMSSPITGIVSSLLSGNLAGGLVGALNAALGNISPSFGLSGPFGLNFSVNPGTTLASKGLSALGVPSGFGLSGMPGMIASLVMNAANSLAANGFFSNAMSGVPGFGVTPGEAAAQGVGNINDVSDVSLGLPGISPQSTLASLNAIAQTQGPMAALTAAYAAIGMDPQMAAQAAATATAPGGGVAVHSTAATGVGSGIALGTDYGGGAVNSPAFSINQDGSITNRFGETVGQTANTNLSPGPDPSMNFDAPGVTLAYDEGLTGPPGDAPGAPPGAPPGDAPGSEGGPGPGTAGPGGDGGAECFAGSTPVVMANGTRQPIQDVQQGDMVQCRDWQTVDIVSRPVTKKWSFSVPSYRVRHINGLRVTEQHRFATGVDEWRRCQDLQVGDRVLSPDGSLVQVVRAEPCAPAFVYNLEVEDHHNFIVADDEYRYVVHNGGGGGK